MIDAKLLPSYKSEPLTVYGVWIPRKGDNLRLTVEVVWQLGADFTATLYQKNYADVGDGASTAASVEFKAATGRQSMELLGVKELVRVALTCAPNADAVGLALYRALHPVWFETVRA